ncbi:hypothetical protein Tco_0072758 [Tanacetum coccineum]
MKKMKTLLLDQTKGKGRESHESTLNHQRHLQHPIKPPKDPLTFDELIATPIDFSNFAKNRLKLDKITKADLVGPVYNLLKGTYQSSIELEYNMEECYKTLTGRLDWENPEGDRCPFDLSKPLPLKGRPGHLTIAAEYFFNNDLEYLKSTYSDRKYTTSITKTKAARYELLGIENMILKQLSVTKVDYDRDVERGIKHWGPKRKLFYRSQLNGFSKHYVFSHLKILSVVFMMVAADSPRRVRFISTCSYYTNICKDILKAQEHVSKDFYYSDTLRLP